MDGENYIRVHEMPSIQGFWVGVKNGIVAYVKEENKDGGSADFASVIYETVTETIDSME